MITLLETEPIFDQSCVILTPDMLERLDGARIFSLPSDGYDGQVVIAAVAS